MKNYKQLMEEHRERLRKLDTVSPDLESLRYRAPQRPVDWKVQWLDSLLARRTAKFSKPHGV